MAIYSLPDFSDSQDNLIMPHMGVAPAFRVVSQDGSQPSLLINLCGLSNQ
jgi:hypothetical protein